MKPREYYNYPQKQKRFWWLPLALIPILVIITVVFDPWGTKNPPVNSEPAGTQNGAVNGSYHTVLLNGTQYNILDREYDGAYDLKLLRFSENPGGVMPDGVLELPSENSSIPEDFPREEVLDRGGYEAFCQRWGLSPAFPEHEGSFALVAYGSPHSGSCELQLGDVSVSEKTVTLVLRDRLEGVAADSMAFVLTIPVPDSVTELKIEPLYSQGEYENLKRYGYSGGNPEQQATDAKPVIYLYPATETEVQVRLDYQGELCCTYPSYQEGWRVIAQPDGTLLDEAGQRYNYLYWEGRDNSAYDFSQGFCVPGEETAAFLEDALAGLGLNRREANEFIVYWLPQMEGNPWNLISFQTEAYTQRAKLEISPAPDTLIRVFMAWKPLEAPVEPEPQVLSAPERVGFTVVEWGGCRMK